MDVLQRIHRWLRRGGLLLDLHPEPEQPPVEVTLDGIRNVYLGLIDTTALIGNIHGARAALRSVVEAGWFERERAVVFDFVSHFPGVDEWLQHREKRRSSSVVDRAIIVSARSALSAVTSGDLQVSERVLATRFKRGHGPRGAPRLP
ncbi:MAG TPA: hypothetical protein VFB50_00585 [Chloroflexota bacterium]|nr:hypothetical protein [Chloroflexota bacterium]